MLCFTQEGIEMTPQKQKKWTLRSLQEYGKSYLPGGMSSSFKVNRYTNVPLYLSKAEGAYLFDVTGKKYIDYFMGHGAILLGHKRPEIEQAIRNVLGSGVLAEYDSLATIELAKMITEIIPCAESVRYTNSGSESTMLAMRLARGYTGKEKIIRIDGQFHGCHDYALFNNLAKSIDRDNPGDQTSKIISISSGIPDGIKKTIVLIPWNNIDVFARVVEQEGHNIAGIILNPIDYNNGCITTTSEYLSAINDIAHRNDIVVIYDEVLSGFRTGISCAQGYYGVTPDICTLGKALSNGVPFSAIAGKEAIMSRIMEQELPVVAGGTFAGNLIGVGATMATLNIMKQKDFYINLFNVADYFYHNLQKLFDERGIVASVQHLGSNFFIYFGTRKPVVDYRQFADLDLSFAKKFFRACIREGLYFNTDFTVSAAHTKEDIDFTLEKIRKLLKNIV
jgi:glutamate-1-semialdehyde 2,1-aminomutase